MTPSASRSCIQLRIVPVISVLVPELSVPVPANAAILTALVSASLFAQKPENPHQDCFRVEIIFRLAFEPRSPMICD
jgi:hypothetical protein